MRVWFVEEQRGASLIERLCRVMNVSPPRGLRDFRSRPASRRQRTDMVVLAQIEAQSRLSLDSCGRPRMTEDLKEVGVDIGHRRVGRVRQENDSPDRFQNLSHCVRTGLSLKEHANSKSMRVRK